MEISEFTGRRYGLAIELFQDRKEGLLYEGVLFINTGSSIEVNSYSDWEPEKTTEQMAREKIERSKQVMRHLSNNSEEFNKIESTLPKEYVFSYDYHTGAVMLASEVKGVFNWHL